MTGYLEFAESLPKRPHTTVYGVDLGELHEQHPDPNSSPCVFADIVTVRHEFGPGCVDEHYTYESLCVPYRSYKAAGDWLIWAARKRRPGHTWRKNRRWWIQSYTVDDAYATLVVEAQVFGVPLHRLAAALKIWLAHNSAEEFSVSLTPEFGRLVTSMSMTPANVKLARAIWQV
jgi:hypothetical protein